MNTLEREAHKLECYVARFVKKHVPKHLSDTHVSPKLEFWAWKNGGEINVFFWRGDEIVQSLHDVPVATKNQLKQALIRNLQELV